MTVDQASEAKGSYIHYPVSYTSTCCYYSLYRYKSQLILLINCIILYRIYRLYRLYELYTLYRLYELYELPAVSRRFTGIHGGSRRFLCVAYGDQWSNMIQPFWLIPILAITGLRMRQVLGYTFVIFLFTGLIYGSGILYMGAG